MVVRSCSCSLVISRAHLDPQLRRRGWRAARRTGRPRVPHDGAADGDPLTLAAGERAWAGGRDSHRCARISCGSRDAAVDLRREPSRGSRARRRGSAHTHMRVERVGLEHHRDLALGRRKLVHRWPSKHHRPTVIASRPEIMRKSVDLPQPDGPTSDELAGCDVDIDAVDDFERSVGLRGSQILRSLVFSSQSPCGPRPWPASARPVRRACRLNSVRKASQRLAIWCRQILDVPIEVEILAHRRAVRNIHQKAASVDPRQNGAERSFGTVRRSRLVDQSFPDSSKNAIADTRRGRGLDGASDIVEQRMEHALLVLQRPRAAT